MKAFTHLNIYHLFIYLVIGAFALHVNAADITPEEALDIANSFVQHDKTAQANIRRAPAGTKVSPFIAHKLPSRVATNKDNVYIVNLGNEQGFVIVSGEDGAVSEVLGYCDHGSFNYDDAPVQFIDLLNEYSDGIDSLRNDPSLARPQMPARMSPRRIGGVTDDWGLLPSFLGTMVVEPLLTSKWNQIAPYNMFTPDQCYTGCVPTAVAQVMRYWKWPKQSKGQISVGWSQEEGSIYEDFSGHVYDWDNMLDYYGWSYSMSDEYISYNNTQATAVAYLMADVGKAMGTMYCQENGSPTGWAPNALIENFGYEPGIESVHGATLAHVKDALKAELDAQRPVLYAGYPDEGDGHALVCDGYTSNDYFHFNYGWGGQTNGFYRLSSVPLYINNVDVWTNVRPYDAKEKEIGDFKYGLLANGKADILDYLHGGMNEQNGAVVIPDSVTDPETGITYAVTALRRMAFYHKGYFSKITLGNNIEEIAPYTFINSHIDSVVLSDKMEVVPDEAFKVIGVKHLTIGKNIRKIGKQAFYLCDLNRGIICKSDHVELETESFAHSKPVHGDWENGIVKINKKAFYGATLSASTYFKNLEVLCDSATFGGRWGGGSPFFRIGPKVREIAVTAFDGLYANSIVPMLIVDTLNPYFAGDFYPIIYNKNKTAVLIALSNPSAGWPETIIKMAPGCMRSGVRGTIPQTIVDMEGAYKDSKAPSRYTTLTCPLLVPPVISDATFPDELFAKQNVYLEVPPGTEELYAEAPGWRKFGENISSIYDFENQFTPLPPQDLNYQMVVHSDSLHTSVPVSEVQNIRMSENASGEPVVSMTLDGRDNITADASLIDSLTFRPGFLYEGAEIFTINDSNLTVEAQKCSITFDATTFDDSVQICVRNSVLLPRPSEGVTGGVGIDISMLADSGLVHKLSGVAKITIPFQAPANQSVGAAYYNEQTGEWEPVYMEYNRQTGTATILTDHLSFYTLVTFLNERSKGELFEALREIPALYAWDEGTKMLLKILDSDDPKMEEAIQFKDEMGLWQSLGLDGFYQGAVSVAEPLFDFRPEAINNAVTIMGEIGTAMTILDVVRADLKGDNLAVAAGTLKVIMAKTAGAAASYIGTPVMAASMSLVAFIGVALEKFGTGVQNYKMDYFRTAYRYYYSMAGYNALSPDSRYNNDAQGTAKPHGYFRTTKDWYDYFYPAFVEANMNADQLQMYIEQSVRVYCDQFWTENTDVQTWAFAEARRQGFQSFWDATDALKQQISDEYYAELMNGALTSVFAALRNKQIVQANNRAAAKINAMAKWMNKKVAFRIIDSSRQEGEVSQFAGRRIGFAATPKEISDPDKWIKTIDEKGECALGWFTTYALVHNMVPFQITLFDENGDPEKVFDFQLDGTSDKTIINIDPTQGTKADTKRIDDIHFVYTPDTVVIYSSGYDYQDRYSDQVIGEVIYLDNDQNFYADKARFSTEVERFFNRHDFITVDSTGTFTLGDDITGRFVGDSASGSFVINTDYKFFIKSAQQFIDLWNNPKTPCYERIRGILNGSAKHQMQCQYTIKRRQVDDHYEYDIKYTGLGAFDLTVQHVSHYGISIDWESIVINEDEAPYLSLYDISVGTASKGGEVTLEYKTTLK